MKKRGSSGLLASLFVWGLPTVYSSDNESFAHQRQRESEGLVKQFSPKDVPGYMTDRPPETSLNNHVLLDSEAQKGFTKNEAAQILLESANKRPYFALDSENDPIALNSKEALSNPQSFLNRQTYQNRLDPQYILKTCTERKPDRKYTCSKQLSDPTVSIQPALYSNWWCSAGNHQPDDPRCRAKTYFNPPKMYQAEQITLSPESWKSTCDLLEEKAKRGICKIVKKTCVDNSTHHIPATIENTGTIRSHPITKDCWHYTYEYECVYPECLSLRASNCEQMESKCVLKEGEKCVAWEQTFRCPNSKPQFQQVLRVQDQGTPIPEGNEYLQFKPNAEMNEAITKLYVLQEIQNDLGLNAAQNNKTQTIPQIFKGDNGKCTIAFGGFSDCCGNGKGWGHDMHLRKCNGDEKILAQKRANGLCVEIGRPYCAERKLRVCIRKKRSFCCFPSKLALVLHKQGREKVGIGWGTSKDANCRGFTIDELSRLNFEELDLSEFYHELISKMKNPSTNAVQRNLQNRMGQISSSMKNEQRKAGY